MPVPTCDCRQLATLLLGRLASLPEPERLDALTQALTTERERGYSIGYRSGLREADAILKESRTIIHAQGELGAALHHPAYQRRTT